MAKKTKETNTKKCGDCIHLYACETWNEGRLENAEAEHCALYETVKESNAYYLGLCDGKDKWIPVGEGMPEAHKINFCDKDFMVSDFVLVTRYDCGSRGVSIAYTVDGVFSGILPVIAWQPLPEPYKEEGNNDRFNDTDN